MIKKSTNNVVQIYIRRETYVYMKIKMQNLTIHKKTLIHITCKSDFTNILSFSCKANFTTIAYTLHPRQAVVVKEITIGISSWFRLKIHPGCIFNLNHEVLKFIV